MPAVGDLYRVGGTDADALCVGAGPVAAHDLHAGMLAQLGGEGVGGPVLEQVQRSVGEDVDDDRP